MIRDIRNLFEHEEDYYISAVVINFWSKKVKVIEEHYNLKSILIELKHT